MRFATRPASYKPPAWPFAIDWSHSWTRGLRHLGIVGPNRQWVNLAVANTSYLPGSTDGTEEDTQYGLGRRLVAGDFLGVRWTADPWYDIPGAITFGGYQASAALRGQDGGIITSSSKGYFDVSGTKNYELGVLNHALVGQLSDGSTTISVNLTGVDADLVAGDDQFRGALFTWDGRAAGKVYVRAGRRENSKTAWSSNTRPANRLQQWGGESGGPDFEWVGVGLFGFVHARYMDAHEREYTTSGELLNWRWLEPYGRKTYFLGGAATMPVVTVNRRGGVTAFRDQFIGPDSMPTPVFQSWVDVISSTYHAPRTSSTTAERPVKGLWVGRQHFDTSLGHDIWYNGTAWVDATGAAV